MNDRPEQWDCPKPVQDTMSDADFAMIVQEMARSPGYHEQRAQRVAALEQLRQDILRRQNAPPAPEESAPPEPVQEMMSDADFTMIVQR